MKGSVGINQHVCIIALALLIRTNTQAQEAARYVDGQVIVKLNNSVQASGMAVLQSSLNASVLKKFPSIGAELWEVSGISVEDAVKQYRHDPRLQYIEPNYIVSLIREKTAVIPNDPRFPQQWGLHNTGQTGGTPDADIDAPEAWDIETGKEVVIGVIDTGVDYRHQDLATNIWVNPGEIPNNRLDDDRNGFIDDIHGWDFVNNDNDPLDDNGHGTHVSGTAAAIGNNGIGVAGVSWSAKIMALKFLDANGSGTNAGAIAAIDYATRMGARLTSNSWGGGEFSQALRDAIAASGNAGMLFIAAAGNGGSDGIGDDNDRIPHYPSSYDLDNIIAVAATDQRDAKTIFSNFGATSVDLGAPGDDILSTLPGNSYGTISGTSMSTPHVSGTVSLIWSRVPGLTHLQVKDLIIKTVDLLPSLQGRTVSGGRLNAFNALILAEPDSIPPAAVTDLAASDPKSNFITLTWTASGDDSSSGKAAFYDIHYSTSPIDSGNFELAAKVPGAPAPKAAGSSETFTVGGLDFNTTYYFALKVIDEQGNVSSVSNSPSATTLGIPNIAVFPNSLADSLLTGAKSTHSLTISNTAEGTLDFDITITGVDTSAVSLAWKMDSRELKSPTQETKNDHSVHRAQYEAYAKKTENADSYATAHPIAEPRILELYRRFQSTVADSQVIFHDDMESGINGWSHYATHPNGIDQWAQTTRRASSGVTSWNVSQHASFGSDALQSPPIDLTGYENATLAFQHWHNFDDCGGDTTFEPDGGIVEVSIDGGSRWTQIFPLGGYPYVLDDICDNPLAFFRAYSHDGGNGRAFIPALFDLTPYAGNVVLLRWHAGWDCGNCESNEGWFVDDVTVYSTSFIGWLSANPTAGTVFASTSVDITVTFDAEGLNGGDYDASLLISSNDPDSSIVRIPAHLHVTGAPDIALSDTTIDFGTVLIGDTARVKLIVSNPGTDPLTVSSISIDRAEYAAAPRNFSLDPKQRQEVLVSFMPRTTGEISGTLTITSNDPDEPMVTVALRGNGVPPPEITVSPDSLRENLLTGQTAKQVLTITNTGLSDLTFDISIENIAVIFPSTLAKKRAQNSASEARQSRASADSQSTLLNPSGRSPSSRPEPPKQWGDLPEIRQTDDSITSVTMAKPNRKKNMVQALLPVVIEDPAGDGGAVDIITLRGLSAAGELQIEMEFATVIDPANFGGYLSLDLDQDPRTGVPPSFGLPGQDVGVEYEFTFFSLASGVVNLVDAISRSLIASYAVEIQPKTLRFSALLSDLGNDDGKMNVSGVLGDASGPTDWFPDQGHGTIGSGVTWVSVDPSSGVVSPANSVEIAVTFDAIGLQGGDYTADLVVANNDPDEKQTIIPVHLQVTDAADIAANLDTLDFGQVFIGVKKTLQVVVQNNGTLDLLIFSAVAEPNVFTVSPAFAGIDPGETEVFKVRFLPQATTNYNGTLTFTSNDPDQEKLAVTLLGQGVIPPDISISPTSFAFNLNAGDSAAAVLTLTNSGGSDLNFKIRDVEAAGAAALGGQKLYWTEQFSSITDTLHRSNLDGTEIETIFTVDGALRGIAIDEQAGRVYWVDGGAGNIRSSNLDGSDVKVLVAGLTVPVDITLDPAGGKMYWTDFSAGNIGRANLDGSGVEIIVQGARQASKAGPGPFEDASQTQASAPRSDEKTLQLDSPWGIALDLTNGKVYFTDQNGDRLGRANLDGTNVETIIQAGINGPRGIKLDVAAGKIYFVDSFNDAIKRANLDGSGIETVLSFTADANALDIELDINQQQLYWSDNILDRIQRANFNGSNVQVIIEQPAPDTQGIIGVGILAGTNWLTEVPNSGTTPAGASDDINIKVNTKGLVDGDYNATIFVASNVPTKPEVTAPVTLHVTGVPRIAVSDDTLDYGPVFIGASVTDTLIVSNVGSALLTVSDIFSDNSAYTADTTHFSLLPGKKQQVSITFKPGASGEISGTLTIASDALDQMQVTVALLGKGVVPPDIAVTPDSLSADLFAGETTTQMLTISNSGGSDLLWQAAAAFASRSTVISTSPTFHSRNATASGKTVANTPPVKPAPQDLFTFGSQQSTASFNRNASGMGASSENTVSLEVILENLNQDFGTINSLIPNRFDFSEGGFGNSIFDGGNDMYDGGNFLSTNLGGPLNYSDNVIVNSPIFGKSGRYFTRKYPGLFVLAADMEGVNAFEISGELGADGLGNVDGAILETVLFGTAYQGFVKRVYNAGDPSVNHLIIIAKNPSAKHEFSTNTNDDFHRVFNLSGTRRLYYLLYAGANGFYIDNAATLKIMNAFLQALNLAPAWITVTPDSGKVAAGASVEAAVKFDATGLPGGDHDAGVVISSNDPDEPTVTVAAHLHVTGAPAIAVSDTSLDFGAVFIGRSLTDTLIVSSIGTDSLLVSDIASDHAAFIVDTTRFSLAPGEKQKVVIKFSPSSTGKIMGTLTISSNARNTPQAKVLLAGEAVEPPVISVSPEAFEFRVEEGDSAVAVMTIANSGGSPLNFRIRDEESAGAASNSFNNLHSESRANGQTLYWTESLSSTPDTLHRSNLDGTEVETIFTNIFAIGGIAIDAQAGRIYWTDRGEGNIRTSSLDGSDVKVLVSGLSIPLDIAIDPAGGKMYWTNFSANSIGSANLDGSDMKIIVQGAQSAAENAPGPEDDAPRVKTLTERSEEKSLQIISPWGLDLDLAHGKIYWAEQTGDRIGRANLDGSSVEAVIDSSLDGPRGIKLDVAGGKIYFVDSFNQAIKRANLDGSGVETLLSLSNVNPLDIELDINTQQLYWTDNFVDQILRANFDGSNVQVVTNQPSPFSGGPLGIGLSLGKGWLTEIPTSGTIAPGAKQDITIKADASELAIGDYSASILVESNDPQKKQVVVPVQLHVIAGDFFLSISDTLKTVPGDTAEVPVFLRFNTDNLAIAALGAAIKATRGIPQFVGFTPGPIIPATPTAGLNVSSPAPDSIRLTFFSLSGGHITKEGLFVTLRYAIPAGTNLGSTSLLTFSELSALDSNARPRVVGRKNGKLTVIKTPSIAGNVKYCSPTGGGNSSKPVAGLTATLSRNGVLAQEKQTDAAGSYALADILPRPKYRVELHRASGGIGSAIGPTDALLALHAVSGAVNLKGCQKLAADVNGNARIDSTDAQLIFDRFLGTISQFPVGDWRAFPASYDIDATPEAWKTAPRGIDYPLFLRDQLEQNHYAVVRGDVNLDWKPASSSAQALVKTEAPLQLSLASIEVVPGTATMTWQVRLDGAALERGIYALGFDLQYPASSLEIINVRWGNVISREGLQANYRILTKTPISESDTTEPKNEMLTGRLRFGGFSTSSAAIRAAGILLEIEARWKAEMPAGTSLPIRIINTEAMIGASEATPSLNKGHGSATFEAIEVAVVDGSVQIAALPTEFALQPNYPNPFNPTTQIRYQLPEPATVKLEIFNALGQKVRTLVNDVQQAAGFYVVAWDGRNEAGVMVTNGIYFYQMKAQSLQGEGGFSKTRKMMMLQ